MKPLIAYQLSQRVSEALDDQIQRWNGVILRCHLSKRSYSIGPLSNLRYGCRPLLSITHAYPTTTDASQVKKIDRLLVSKKVNCPQCPAKVMDVN